jgi:hypothetical protein
MIGPVPKRADRALLNLGACSARRTATSTPNGAADARLYVASILCAVLAAAAVPVVAAQKPQKIPVEVSVVKRDGFVTPGLAAIQRLLITQINKRKLVRTAAPTDAFIFLLVHEISTSSEREGSVLYEAPALGLSTLRPRYVTSHTTRASLIAGKATVDMSCVHTGGGDPLKGCADFISKRLNAWVEANYEKLLADGYQPGIALPAFPK